MVTRSLHLPLTEAQRAAQSWAPGSSSSKAPTALRCIEEHDAANARAEERAGGSGSGRGGGHLDRCANLHLPCI